jgi:restriction system protein
MSKKSKSGAGGAEFVRWFRPLIDCLRELGAARPREASDWIAAKEKVPTELREALLRSGEERFHNQVQFARQYLVWEGLIDGSKKGIWSLTPLGSRTRLTDEDARKICAKWVSFHAAARATAAKASEDRVPTSQNLDVAGE